MHYVNHSKGAAMGDRFADQVRDLGDAFDDGDWNAVLRRAAASDRRPQRQRLLFALTLLCALAVALPAIALSGRLGSLFGFSTSGTALDEQTLELRDASALESAGAAGTVRLIATREGVAFYVAKSKQGGFCPLTGPSDQARPSFSVFGCMNADASASFPSPAHPVLDFSPGYTPGMKTGLMWISQLRGFAADGIKTIEVIGTDDTILASVPVVDNVYASERSSSPPGEGGIGPAKALVGLDENGTQVWVSPFFQ